jgi:hypothetical protein
VAGSEVDLVMSNDNAILDKLINDANELTDEELIDLMHDMQMACAAISLTIMKRKDQKRLDSLID